MNPRNFKKTFESEMLRSAQWYDTLSECGTQWDHYNSIKTCYLNYLHLLGFLGFRKGEVHRRVWGGERDVIAMGKVYKSLKEELVRVREHMRDNEYFLKRKRYDSSFTLFWRTRMDNDDFGFEWLQGKSVHEILEDVRKYVWAEMLNRVGFMHFAIQFLEEKMKTKRFLGQFCLKEFASILRDAKRVKKQLSYFYLDEHYKSFFGFVFKFDDFLINYNKVMDRIADVWYFYHDSYRKSFNSREEMLWDFFRLFVRGKSLFSLIHLESGTIKMFSALWKCDEVGAELKRKGISWW